MMRDIKFRVWDDNLASQGFLSDDVSYLRADGEVLVDDIGENFDMRNLTIELYTGIEDIHEQKNIRR